MSGIAVGELVIIASICCTLGGSACALFGLGFYLMRRSSRDGAP